MMMTNRALRRLTRAVIFSYVIFFAANIYGFQVYFLPDTLHVNSHGTFNIDLDINQNNDGFRGFKVYVKYDPSLVQFVSAQKGTLVSGFSNYWWKVVQESGDVVRIECIVLGAGLSIDESGTILNLTFSELKDGVDAVSIYQQEFYYADGGDVIPNVTSKSGTIIVNCSALPALTSPLVENISTQTAVLGGTILSDGGSAIIERGVVWSQTSNPTISIYTGKKLIAGTTGTFSVNASGLLPGTTYYFRAYASTYRGTAYTETRSFETTSLTLPVELSAFSAAIKNGDVELRWETQSESNNYGFEIERSAAGHEHGGWVRIGFAAGAGNSNSTKGYSFTDQTAPAGLVQYHLKQIDTDGSFSYSDIVEVNVTVGAFQLFQNYPNPFNASTTIQYQIPQDGFVRLTLFNIRGQLIETIFQGEQQAGLHTCTFNAGTIPSGAYIYKIEAGEFSEIRTLTLLK